MFAEGIVAVSRHDRVRVAVGAGEDQLTPADWCDIARTDRAGHALKRLHSFSDVVEDRFQTLLGASHPFHHQIFFNSPLFFKLPNEGGGLLIELQGMIMAVSLSQVDRSQSFRQVKLGWSPQKQCHS
jgi:hypothetical protein